MGEMVTKMILSLEAQKEIEESESEERWFKQVNKTFLELSDDNLQHMGSKFTKGLRNVKPS